MRFAITYLPANPSIPALNFPKKKFNSRLVAPTTQENKPFGKQA
jgi:hypothetical protein